MVQTAGYDRRAGPSMPAPGARRRCQGLARGDPGDTWGTTPHQEEPQMGIGVSVLLMAAGAIMTFAVEVENVQSTGAPA